MNSVIVALLLAVSPAATLRQDMRALWSDHVIWTRVRAFDAVYGPILKMADALTDGIVKQFPNRF
jgi:hypothetical protein